MDTIPVTVIATIRARAGAEADLRALALSLVAPTRQEPGCLSYDLHQSANEPDTFVFIERWRSPADLERHLATPHIQAAFAQAAQLVIEPPQITQWNQIA